MSKIYCSKCNTLIADDNRYTLEDYKWFELGNRGYCPECEADLSITAQEY